jgi:hypothetical protein
MTRGMSVKESFVDVWCVGGVGARMLGKVGGWWGK